MIAEEVPDAARGPAIDPAQGYLIERLRGGAVIQETGLAKTYFQRQAQQAADEIVPRWADRLGGVRAYTHDHCAAVLMAMAHDWGVEGT